MRNFFIIFLIFLPMAGFSQQMPLLSQYKLNGNLYNPALAGVEQVMNVSLIAREQWAGYDKPPRTFWANFHTRVTSKRFGAGISVYSDRDGLLNNTGIQGMYAYHIPMRDGQLSLGASISLYQYRLNRTDALFRDPMDPLNTNNSRFFSPDANIGAFYKGPGYYAGLSVNNVLQSIIKFGSDEFSNNVMKRVYYVTGGYFYKYSSDITIEPHALIKYAEGYKVQADINCAVMYQLQYWAGLGFRTSGDMLFFIGGNYRNYLFGYAFDYAFTNMHKRNYSTHEIMASVRFGKTTTSRFQGSDIY